MHELHELSGRSDNNENKFHGIKNFAKSNDYLKLFDEKQVIVPNTKNKRKSIHLHETQRKYNIFLEYTVDESNTISSVFSKHRSNDQY